MSLIPGKLYKTTTKIWAGVDPRTFLPKDTIFLFLGNCPIDNTKPQEYLSEVLIYAKIRKLKHMSGSFISENCIEL